MNEGIKVVSELIGGEEGLHCFGEIFVAVGLGIMLNLRPIPVLHLVVLFVLHRFLVCFLEEWGQFFTPVALPPMIPMGHLMQNN